MASEDSVVVPELKAKLVFLFRDDIAGQVGRHTRSEHSFADSIGESRSTVRGWTTAAGTRRPKLNSITNRKIAERFRFPTADWAPWLSSSFEVFKSEYYNLASTLLNSGQTGPRAPRDTTGPLKQGEELDPQRCPIRGLASIELTCGQTQPGKTDVGVTISCGISPIERFPYWITVHTAQVEIDCGKARAAHGSIKGFVDPYFALNGSKGEVRGMWNGGDTQCLAWLFDASSTSIGVISVEPGELARIERLAPGDVIVGTLGTWLKNVEADEMSSQPTTDIEIVDRTGVQAHIEAPNLSIAQRRVMEHLRKCVLDVDDSGYAVLARHELRFVEGN